MTGFSKNSAREYKIYDTRAVDTPLAQGPFGDTNGVPHIHFDQTSHVLFSSGRGDSGLDTYKYLQGAGEPLKHIVSYSMGSVPQKAFSLLPKWSVDITKHEIARGVRIREDGVLEYVAFRSPSRTGQFKEELYPEHPGYTPGNNYTDWAAGQDKPAILNQLREGAPTEQKVAQKANFMSKLKGNPAPV